jgi:glycosyltransferase involved in cell wall biosynthesis
MRILILTAIPFWHPGTNELIELLRDRGIEVEALDIFHGRKINSRGEEENLVSLTGIIRRVYLKLFRKRLVKKHIAPDQLVDIHFVEPMYAKYLLDLPNKMICTLFGSDLFRTTSEQKNQQKGLFEKAVGILLSKNMQPEFGKHFPEQEAKYIFNQYGSKRIDLVIERSELKPTSSFNFPQNKKVITLGYNGKEEQQHLKIINALSNSKALAEQCHFVLPMTYGGSQDYIDRIENEMKLNDFSYSILTNRLSDEEMADLWLSSHICVNMQTTDALASSIKEALAAGNIMLVGEWLPYDIYSELGVVYEKTNFDNLPSRLKNSLDNFDDIRERTMKNKGLVKNFASWQVLIDKWVTSYERIYGGKQ